MEKTETESNSVTMDETCVKGHAMVPTQSPQPTKMPIIGSETGPVGFVASSPEEVRLSRRVNRKMDIAMLPLLSLVYLFNGLDKGNIGNAETQGMTSDTP